MENVEKIRAFIAIYPSSEVLLRLREWMKKLRHDLGEDGIRWIKNEQMHLTLQFLGYIPAEQIEEIQNALRQSIFSHHRFTLKAESLGCFPNISRARVLWVGLSGQTNELQKLKSGFDKILIPFGYKPEPRKFQPHLTVARFSQLSGAQRAVLKERIEKYANLSAGNFAIEKIELMESRLSPRGASYHPVASFSLHGTTC
jgi:RNA 2',3'-cyclic 3'-phosphodiesterase